MSMSKANDGSTNDVQNETSVSGDSRMVALAELTSALGKTAVGPDGKLVPSAKFQTDLRKAESRREILEGLILELSPAGVNAEIWRKLLDGSSNPFAAKKDTNTKVKPGTENPGQTLHRASNRLLSEQKKVDAARMKLEEAERQYSEIKALECGALQWHVTDNLISIMEPAFSMGPAWTIMRAVSSYVSDEDAIRATPMFLGDEKPEAMAKYREIRLNETREILNALDWFSAYKPFEEEVREALLNVVREFADRRSEAAADGRRPRSEKTMKEQPHPKAMADAEEIIAGLAVEDID